MDYESSKSQMADDFYYHQFKVNEIVRFDTGSEADMKFQRADIDVQLHGWGRHANVSEKFRAKDYNDLYLELYSMYPQTLGWMERNEADFLAYFFPQRVLWINKHDLHHFFKAQIQPDVKEEWLTQIQERFPAKNGKVDLNLKGKKVSIIKAYNKTPTKTWDTIGISVPLDWVAEFLPIKEYRL